ncbi:MAG TPA: nuclear transport factor 2 family protein [Bryobacteraceae bacterium]|nr:nuclear transport factor 2 family protein [Bryobacteraceae bacterium]
MATTSTSLENVARTIREMDQELAANVENRDARRLVDAFYSSDAQVLPPHHPPVEGKEAIRGMWEGLLAGGMRRLALDTTRIGISGDLAYGVGRYIMTSETADGVRSERGKYCVIYRLEDGRWRAIVDMFSPND